MPNKEKKLDDVVFTTILRKDRDWLNEPERIGANRHDKLHNIIERIRVFDGE